MSTYYLPSESGWQGSDYVALRIHVVQTYDAVANRSTLTVTLQGRLPTTRTFAGTFYFIADTTMDGTFKCNGVTLGDFTSQSSNNRYTVYVNTDQTWRNVQYNGSDVSWTVYVNHNANGSASVPFILDTRLVMADYGYRGNFDDASATLSLQNNPAYTLTISAGSGSSITVKRNDTVLSNGAVIYRNDILTVTFSANTGYNLNTHKVNGSNFTSGNTYTVTGAVSVTSTATVKSFTLSTTIGKNTTITVNRTSSPLGGGSTGNLSNGSTIYYNDVLKISFSASTGCVIKTHTVNGSTFTSGNNHTVTAAVSVVSSATVNSYSLSLTVGNYVTITVNRTSSPLQGATEGYLSNGSTIYYGDKISISYSISVGATVSTHTLNGTSFNSGVSHTVSGSVTVIVKATLNTYTITRSLDEHSSLVIQRTSSPLGNGSTGTLSPQDVVYYGDTLELTASTDAGYGIDIMSVNNEQYFDNPHTVVVNMALLIQILSKALGFVHIDTGSAIDKYKIVIDSGSSYEQYRAMIDTGSDIIPY